MICLYVDDLLYTGSNSKMLPECKLAMFNEFEMTDNELMSHFLGIEMKQREDNKKMGYYISKEVHEGYPGEIQDE